MIGSFLLCLVFAQFELSSGKKQKHGKVFAPIKIVMRRFNTYMPFVWGENSEKLFFRKTTATLLTFGDKMEVGHIFFFLVFFDKK